MRYLRSLIETFLIIGVLLLPFQTKLILVPASNNYNELSFYLSFLPFILAFLTYLVYQLLGRREIEKLGKHWYFIFTFLAFYLLSIFVSNNQGLAFYKFFVALLAVSIFYLLQQLTITDSAINGFIKRSNIIIAFLASAFLQASLGIYQFLSQHSFSNKYLGLATHDPQLPGTSVIETASGRWLRAYGGLDHPNILAGLLVIAILLSVYLLVEHKIIDSQKKVYSTLAVFIFYFVLLTALFFTFSRSAWLALALGLVVFVVQVLRLGDQWTKGRFFVLLLFTVGFLILLGSSYQDLVSTRFQSQTRLENISISERSEQQVIALDLIKKHPLLGVGSGGYLEEVANFDDDYPQPVHNSYLLVASELGLFALLSLLFFLFFFSFVKAKELYAWPLFLSLLVLLIFEHWFFSLPFGAIFFFFVLGLI